ncbi:MAG: hypothetical protein ABIA21_04105, partial [Candidatus Aenigmatarchaeota archaeon]
MKRNTLAALGLGAGLVLGSYFLSTPANAQSYETAPKAAAASYVRGANDFLTEKCIGACNLVERKGVLDRETTAVRLVRGNKSIELHPSLLVNVKGNEFVFVYYSDDDALMKSMDLGYYGGEVAARNEAKKLGYEVIIVKPNGRGQFQKRMEKTISGEKGGYKTYTLVRLDSADPSV